MERAFRVLRVVLREEAVLEQEQRAVRPGRVFKDVHEQSPEVDLDSQHQFGERNAEEVVVVGEGEFPRVEVDLDQDGLAGVAVEAGAAFGVNAQDCGQFVEQAGGAGRNQGRRGTRPLASGCGASRH